ncbi:MAG: DUF523 domain-containing protein [Lawsonibacter sp.]|nr:DUF523 domain-containing protein [Lawsonibacter sp.]
MNILVSHCFLGEPCRYDGASRLDRQIIELHRAGHNLIPVCPEVLGGLSVPRTPAEIQPDGRVLTEDGVDVTAAYQAGAERALAIARENGCTVAILKSRSPSCGCGEVYDGTFTHTVKPGWGVTARLLEEAGFAVMDEEHLQASLYDL